MYVIGTSLPRQTRTDHCMYVFGNVVHVRHLPTCHHKYHSYFVGHLRLQASTNVLRKSRGQARGWALGSSAWKV